MELSQGYDSLANHHRRITSGGYENMLWTIAVILVFLWFLGLVTAFTLGGLIHILLGVAVIVILIHVFQGRKAS